MIINEVCKVWPEDKETPSFKKNSTETGKLIAFLDRLESDDRFIYKKYGLGRNAIKEMVLMHMRERRRAQKDATLTETASDTVSADDSSSTNGTPPGLFDKRRKEFVSYFNPGESLYKLIFRTVIFFVNASLTVFLDLDHDTDVAFGLLRSV